MTLGQRLNRVLVRMMRYQEGAAIDYSRDKVSHGSGGHGKHGTTTTVPSFGIERPPIVVWSDVFDAIISEAEREADAYERGRRHISTEQADPRARMQMVGMIDALYGSGREVTRAELGKRIRDYEGRSVAFVAFAEGCSVDTVERARNDIGVRRVDGLAFEKNERPLTAPPREALRQLAERENDAS